jgi:hypothetical protein
MVFADAEQTASQPQKILDLNASADQNLSVALESSRPLQELDGRVTTLMLMSISLLGLSMVENKPQQVEVLGFSLAAGSWLFLAGPICAMVIYLSCHLMMLWWNTYQIWKLRGNRVLSAALAEVEAIYAIAKKMREGYINGLLSPVWINRDFLTPDNFQYPRKEGDKPDPSAVRAWLKETLDKERSILQSLDYFRFHPAKTWEQGMKIAFDYEIALAELKIRARQDNYGEEAMRLFESRTSSLRAIRPEPLDVQHDSEQLKQVNGIEDGVLQTLRKITWIARLVSIQIWTMLVVPNALAWLSVLFFLYTVFTI